MALVLRNIFVFNDKLWRKFEDPRVDHFPLISSHHVPLVIGIIAAYFYFVLSFGPKFMKDRKPFKLDSFIIAFNVFQVLANGINVTVALRHFLKQDPNWLCILPPYGDTSYSAKVVTQCCYYYFLLKITDLFDTVFFILRKKEQQATFLHIYHHFGMIVMTYVEVKFLSGGGHAIILGLVNSYVHLIMYGYYLATSLKIDVANYWKKIITQIQMIQFAVIIVHNVIPLFVPCNFFKVGNFFLIAQNSFMLFLFSDFYYKTYVKAENKLCDKSQ